MGEIESVKQQGIEIVSQNHQKARLLRGRTGVFIFTITNNTNQEWPSDSAITPIKDALDHKGENISLGKHEVRTLKIHVTPLAECEKDNLSLKFFFKSKELAANFGQEISISIEVIGPKQQVINMPPAAVNKNPPARE